MVFTQEFDLKIKFIGRNRRLSLRSAAKRLNNPRNLLDCPFVFVVFKRPIFSIKWLPQRLVERLIFFISTVSKLIWSSQLVFPSYIEISSATRKNLRSVFIFFYFIEDSDRFNAFYGYPPSLVLNSAQKPQQQLNLLLHFGI